MSLNDLLAAELRRCKAECMAVNAELLQIVARADPEKLVELEDAIRGALQRLKEAADRLHDATIALRSGIRTRAE